MAIITQISLQKNNSDRCNLFIDGKFVSGLSVETVMLNRLKVGMEIDENSLNQLIEESEKKSALTKATDYISKYVKTKRQVKEYLLKKGYTEEIAYFCIDKLKEYGYIDDVDYSKRFINANSKNNGKKLIEYKLMMKGVKKQDIEDAYFESTVDGRENAKNLAVKYLKNKEKNLDTKSKTYRYLLGKGFSYEEVSYAISNLFDED